MQTNKTKKRIPCVLLGEELYTSRLSTLRRYKGKVSGNDKWLSFLEFELVTLLFSNLPSCVGYFLRKLFYNRIFKSVGRSVIIGKGMTIRNPHNITIGNRVAIDDYSMLDASGAGEKGIVLGNDSIISRNCVIQGKHGPVNIGDKVVIGCNTVVSSITGIIVGNSVLIGGHCYMGGGRYVYDSLDVPIMDQGLCSQGPIVINDDVWIGAGTTILDGVRIGKGCIVGAGAVVTKDVPEYSVAIGVPANVIKKRENKISVIK
ncbi:MAG: DapH/DapD/GlmU-related protein [Thermodesulfobacteriota bacterium]